jgi:signal peptidase I
MANKRTVNPSRRGGGEPSDPATKRGTPSETDHTPSATRETVESIVVAIILAFLFRGYVAEAFVIPTGSMAQTLRGRHMDIVCPECDYQYNTGASQENVEDGHAHGQVYTTTCPICRHPVELDKPKNPNQRSFNGDRILVSKFAYELTEPHRWDVIVFKYPGNAKQNYIKRLIGLPGETIRIRHGDIHVLDELGNAQIVRKPPSKLRAMLQLVDDTDHVAKSLKKAGWPSRWQQASSLANGQEWLLSEDGKTYVAPQNGQDSWLRYRHLAPQRDDWGSIDFGTLPTRAAENRGELITDYYCYNDDNSYSPSRGTAWVGDLALECRVDAQSDTGELLLDLVEGGTHYGCRIDIATGAATLSIRDFEGNSRPFLDEATNTEATDPPSAATKLRGSGKHKIRFANCDDELLLWIDERVVEFDGPTTYRSPRDVAPKWSPQDPGDMAPAGIGSSHASLAVSSLRVLRDIYYLTHQAEQGRDTTEYDVSDHQVRQAFLDPTTWDSTQVFQSRRSIQYTLGPDQFFPLGDNSPQSRDARLWSDIDILRRTGNHDPPPYVERDLLIGKALVVYWPHGWRPSWPLLSKLTLNIAFIPNFGQIGLIR